MSALSEHGNQLPRICQFRRLRRKASSRAIRAGAPKYESDIESQRVVRGPDLSVIIALPQPAQTRPF